MIWHIFKKDVRLLWPLAALMAATQFVLAGIMFASGVFHDAPEFRQLSDQLPTVVMVAIAIFIAVVVHQDAPCSQNQDWLARPIVRRDLLIAKLLIVILMVQGPMLLVDIAQGIANGFSVGVVAKMAILRSLFVMSWTIPVLALASLTENVVQAIAVGILVMIAGAGFSLLFRGGIFSARFPTDQSGIAWVENTLGHSVVLVATIAVLGLQYIRRAPQIARWTSVATYAVFLLFHFLPWDAAFAVQTLISPVADANSISAVFDPSQPKEKFPDIWPNTRQHTAYIPVRFTGVAADKVLYFDLMETRLFDASGKMVERSNQYSHGGGMGASSSVRNKLEPMFPIWNNGEVSDADTGTIAYQRIDLPPDVYRRLRDQNLRLEFRFWLTEARAVATRSYATAGDDHHMPYLGRCAAKIFDGYVAEFRCLQPSTVGENISCKAIHLGNVTPDVHPDTIMCLPPNYEPYPESAMPDGLNRIDGDAQFPRKVGNFWVPIEEPELEKSQLVVSAYKPAAHFMKTVVIPSIHLGDWEAELETNPAP